MLALWDLAARELRLEWRLDDSDSSSNSDSKSGQADSGAADVNGVCVAAGFLPGQPFLLCQGANRLCVFVLEGLVDGAVQAHDSSGSVATGTGARVRLLRERRGCCA